MSLAIADLMHDTSACLCCCCGADQEHDAQRLYVCAGMGSDSAEAVLCKYPTPRSLFEAYRAVRGIADQRDVSPVICATKVCVAGLNQAEASNSAAAIA